MGCSYRKERGTWAVTWREVNGRLRTKDFKDKLDAERIDAFIKSELKRAPYGLEAALQDELARLGICSHKQNKGGGINSNTSGHQTSVPPASRGYTLNDITVLYLKDKRFKKKASIKNVMDGMKIPLNLYGSKPIRDITRLDLSDILHQTQSQRLLVKRGNNKEEYVSSGTVSTRMRVLRAVLNWAYDYGYLETKVSFPRIPTPRYEKTVPPSQQERDDLIDVAKPHLKRAILISTFVGVRVGESELLRMTWQDVDLEHRFIRVQSADKNPNQPWRDVPIHDDLYKHLCEWKKEDDAKGVKFIITYNDKPIKSFKTTWRTARRDAGITRSMKPYSMRHFFGSEAIKGGASLSETANVMGHKSLRMLMEHYLHVSTEQKRGVISSLPGLTRDVDISHMHGHEQGNVSQEC